MTGALWASDDARTATGGVLTAAWRANGVSIDSRTVEPGDLFVALKGPRFDGHDYVADAVAAGAAAGMVSAEPENGAPYLVVDDTLRGITGLATFARERCAGRIVAVTGSAGKTGTKEALRFLLAESGITHSSVASHNNHWGVPLSLARMPAGAAYGVFEVGMSRAGEIAPLSRLVRPHVAIVTTVEVAHLEFFDSVEAIADAKSEIFDGMEAGGFAILSRDNPHFDRLATAARKAGAEVIGFGAHPQAEARVLEYALLDDGSTVSAEIRGEKVTYKVGTPGRHWVQNSLAVLAAVQALGADLGRAALALCHIDPGLGRGRRIQVVMPDGAFGLIDESYNANPASMRAALQVLSSANVGTGGRRIAVLGDMLELGHESAAMHVELAAEVERQGVDLVFTIGRGAEVLYHALSEKRRGAHFGSADLAADHVVRAVRSSDVVLVKGSQAIGLTAVTHALTALSERRPA